MVKQVYTVYVRGVAKYHGVNPEDALEAIITANQDGFHHVEVQRNAVVDDAVSSASMKFNLRRIPLNKGGYNRYGKYYGVGIPLYQAECVVVGGDDVVFELRARNRFEARLKVREKYPNATFYN